MFETVGRVVKLNIPKMIVSNRFLALVQSGVNYISY